MVLWYFNGRCGDEGWQWKVRIGQVKIFYIPSEYQNRTNNPARYQAWYVDQADIKPTIEIKASNYQTIQSHKTLSSRHSHKNPKRLINQTPLQPHPQNSRMSIPLPPSTRPRSPKPQPHKRKQRPNSTRTNNQNLNKRIFPLHNPPHNLQLLLIPPIFTLRPIDIYTSPTNSKGTHTI